MATQVVNPNTTMGASGANHAPGVVPDPGATAGTTHFLREDATWAVPAGGGGGVSSLDGITGAVTLVAGSGVTITDNSPSAGDITIAATGGGSGVSSLNSLTGALSLTSTGATVSINPSGSTIDLEVTGSGAPLRGTGTITINGGSYSSLNITVTGATTAMYAVPCLAPATYSSGSTPCIPMTAAVTSANTVTVQAYGLGSGTANYPISVLVFS